MTLDSYLRDLLGSGGLKVNIVDDNAANNSSSTEFSSLPKRRIPVGRSSSWYKAGSTASTSTPDMTSATSSSKSKQKSRWGGMPRRKSDSVLGKPQRRSSIEDAMEACQNARMLIDELSEEGEGAEKSAELLVDTTNGRPNTIVRAFSESRGAVSAGAAEQLVIQKTMRALHHYRSRQQQQRTDKRILSSKEILSKDIILEKSLSSPPPKLPKRRGSHDQITPTTSPGEPQTATTSTTTTTTTATTRTPSPKDNPVSMRPTTIDFPESLRELPYRPEAS